MKIELTQEELHTIVRKYYNLSDNVTLEVKVEQPLSSEVSAAPASIVTKEVKCDDVTDLLTDVAPKKKRTGKRRSKKRKHTLPGHGIINIPKNPRLDYTVYGEAIEDFLKSGQDFTLLPLDDGLKNSGMLYRYRTAAEMFGFRDQITLNAPRHRNILIMSLPGKSPQNYSTKLS